MDGFILILERTTLVDIYGNGENLQKSLLEIMGTLPEECWGDTFRELLRVAIESEAGITGEEQWRKK